MTNEGLTDAPGAAAPVLVCRSPVYHRLAQHSVRWTTQNGYTTAAVVEPAGPAPRIGLCDVSHLARVGFKGRGACAWLGGQGVAVPERPNEWVDDASGCMSARLGTEDMLILAAPSAHSDWPRELERRWRTDSAGVAARRGYPVPRQYSHAAFLLFGRESAELCARLCAVDLRPARFHGHAIAQTLVAHSVATVMRCDRGATLAYLVLVDSSQAEYLWDQLADASAAFAGRVVGLEQLPPA